MGETDFHISLIVELITALRLFFADAADVYVAGDIMFYYVEGDTRKDRQRDWSHGDHHLGGGR